MIKKLSILVPAFNEEKTVFDLLIKVVKTKYPVDFEIIVVNDGSSDRTKTEIQKAVKKYPKHIKLINHQQNSGKGSAIKTALKHAKGEYCVIQDADLEYDPKDIVRMLGRLTGQNVVVYGTRLKDMPVLSGKRRTPFILHYIGNRMLSLITSLLYGVWLTDMETCYKMFPKDSLNKIDLKSKGFEFEPEITTKLLKAKYKLIEIPIKTKPRGYEEGKKINTVKDGTRALYYLFKYRFTD